MFGTPSFDSPLTYFGVLLITVGAYLALSGFGILKIEKYTTPEGVKSWGAGIILLFAGFAILFMLPSFINQLGGSGQQEVSIMNCQNDPNAGIVKAGTPVVLTWGWTTDNEIKRDEVISISSFIVAVDGKTQNINEAQKVLKSTNTILWNLSIGKPAPGIHEISLVRILSQDFTESSGTTPAGRMATEVCELVVK